MSDALSIAASGLKSEEFYIDKIANDLANLNTNNYKATKITFEDVLYQNINGTTPLFQNQTRVKPSFFKKEIANYEKQECD